MVLHFEIRIFGRYGGLNVLVLVVALPPGNMKTDVRPIVRYPHHCAHFGATVSPELWCFINT